MVGQRPLEPLAEVRILPSEPYEDIIYCVLRCFQAILPIYEHFRSVNRGLIEGTNDEANYVYDIGSR